MELDGHYSKLVAAQQCLQCTNAFPHPVEVKESAMQLLLGMPGSVSENREESTLIC